MSPLPLPDYRLRIIEEGDNARLYQLVPPEGTEMQSVRLAFLHPDQKIASIVIYGDLCPGTNGVISATGYDLRWFMGAGSDDYLLSKFLTKNLHWDAMAAYIDSRVEDEFSGGQEESTWMNLQEQVRDGQFSYDGHDVDRLYQAITEIDDDAYASCISYAPRDSELLLAIRATFRALYLEVEQQRDLEEKMGESRRLIAASVDKGEEEGSAGAADTRRWWERLRDWRPEWMSPFKAKKSTQWEDTQKLQGAWPPSDALPTPPRTMEPPRKPRSPR